MAPSRRAIKALRSVRSGGVRSSDAIERARSRSRRRSSIPCSNRSGERSGNSPASRESQLQSLRAEPRARYSSTTRSSSALLPTGGVDRAQAPSASPTISAWAANRSPGLFLEGCSLTWNRSSRMPLSRTAVPRVARRSPAGSWRSPLSKRAARARGVVIPRARQPITRCAASPQAGPATLPLRDQLFERIGDVGEQRSPAIGVVTDTLGGLCRPETLQTPLSFRCVTARSSTAR